MNVSRQHVHGECGLVSKIEWKIQCNNTRWWEGVRKSKQIKCAGWPSGSENARLRMSPVPCPRKVSIKRAIGRQHSPAEMTPQLRNNHDSYHTPRTYIVQLLVPTPHHATTASAAMSSEQGKPATAAQFFDSAATEYEEFTGGCTRELAFKLLDLPQLSTLSAPDAHLLDNACGTGIVAEELAKRCAAKGAAYPTVSAVDAAQKMVDLARKKFDGTEHAANVTFQQMPGEKLDFPDDTFSHSITNLGILFFADADAGAREIYRTLKPGGVAVVTSWAGLSYLDKVIRPAQKAVRPEAPTYKFPIPDTWFSVSHAEETFKKTGFQSVEILEMEPHYGAVTMDDLSHLLGTKFSGALEEFSDEEKGKFREEVSRLAEKAAVPYTMADGRQGVGIPMRAIVVMCRK